MQGTNPHASSGKIWLVPTPIGNLDDITFRAVQVLQEADMILAEDTRNSAFLLKHFNITTGMRSYHMHNEHQQTPRIISEVQSGQNIALITDAGTPGISDPGYLLVRACIEHGIHYEVLPGATAFVPALIKAGLPNHHFVFEGFLPPKKGRQTRLQQLAIETRTMVFYESPHKLLRTLQDFYTHLGNRPASVSRELTKKFEETVNGSLTELISHFEIRAPKGEFVLVVGGAGG